MNSHAFLMIAWKSATTIDAYIISDSCLQDIR